MIFRRELALQVRAGRKTQTRRPVRPGETACRYHPGHAYAVQPGRGKTAIAHILVETVEQQQLADLTLQDAKAEGFRTRDEFFAYWRDLHDAGVPARTRDLLERLVDAPGPLARNQIHPGLPAATLTRRLNNLERQGLARLEHDGRWEITDQGADLLTDPLDGMDLTQPVWAITFRLDNRDVPRLLAWTGRPGPGVSGEANRDDLANRGYVQRHQLAMRDEPEAIDPALIRPDWRQRSERLDAELARAQQHGIDVTNLERDLERAIERRLRVIQRVIAARTARRAA